VRFVTLAILTSVITGCGHLDGPDDKWAITAVTTDATTAVTDDVGGEPNQSPANLRADGATLGSLVYEFAREHGLSVVVEEAVAARTVSGTWKGQPIDVILRSVARAAGTQCSQDGDLYIIWAPNDADRVSTVIHLGSYAPDQVSAALSTALSSTNGKIINIGGDVWVVSDNLAAVRRAARIAKELASAKSTQWVVELSFVTVSHVQGRLLELAASEPTAVIHMSAGKVFVAGDISMVLNWLKSRQHGTHAWTWRGTVGACKPFNIAHQTIFQVATSSIAGSGATAISSSGFTAMPVGMTVQCELFASETSQTLRLDLTDSTVISVANGVPNTDSVQVHAETTLTQEGVPILLGTIEHGDRSSTDEWGLTTGVDDSASDSVVQVWATVRHAALTKGRS
jgi:hypothetical protein